ncbi:MAG: VanZ family protein [bacterium]|jgi:hypothetical protein|nr:VanZ family protein [bacterium]
MMKLAPSWTRPEVHAALYALLLVLTPFLLLRNYLQGAIGEFSRFRVDLFGQPLLLVPLLAALLAAVGLWLARRRLNRRTLPVLLLVGLLWAAGQQVSDYYFGHTATDLQHNWHTIAYGIFALLFWRAAQRRGLSAERIIVPGLATALALSAMDEGVQVIISTRIFDVGDIGKDGWGAAIGLSAVTLHEAWPALRREGFRLARPRLRDYRCAAFPQLVYALLFAFIFLSVGSLFTDAAYVGYVLAISAGAFIALFLLVHLLGKPGWRWAALGLMLTLAALQAWMVARQPRGRVHHVGRHRVVYSGVPVPLADLLIHEDGSFRPIDKKHSFNKRDQQTLVRQTSHILLIGSGMKGRGGQGFPEPFPVQFLPDLEEDRAVQVIVLPTTQAVAVYNRLRDEGRRVTFVVHTGC